MPNYRYELRELELIHHHSHVEAKTPHGTTVEATNGNVRVTTNTGITKIVGYIGRINGVLTFGPKSFRSTSVLLTPSALAMIGAVIEKVDKELKAK